MKWEIVNKVWNYCRWKYAGNSVLEVHIRRHSRMWSWSNIKQHRQLLKTYKNVYKNKLTQSKLSEETQRQLQVWIFSLWKSYILVPLWNNSLDIMESNPHWWFYKSTRGLWKYLFNLKFCVTCWRKQKTTSKVPFKPVYLWLRINDRGYI